MGILQPITKKQLREIVQCYAAVLPEWEIVGGDSMVRSEGPVTQQIGFESLRSGAYRPAMGIRALPLPTVAMLHQFLDIKHRETFLREHPSRWENVATAMEQQFRPSIRKPLDLREVKILCEQEAGESTNDLCMLAILSAYLGDSEEALSYCDRMQALSPPALAPQLEWEQRHKEFGRQLREAIQAGNERQFLDTVSD
ncbi:MAG: hypothetical protein K8S55_14520 [Phycisphaerae bacterium]|nr:hypothetical protein [Phycisphaerae bacterium]